MGIIDDLKKYERCVSLAKVLLACLVILTLVVITIVIIAKLEVIDNKWLHTGHVIGLLVASSITGLIVYRLGTPRVLGPQPTGGEILVNSTPTGYW